MSFAPACQVKYDDWLVKQAALQQARDTLYQPIMVMFLA